MTKHVNSMSQATPHPVSTNPATSASQGSSPTNPQQSQSSMDSGNESFTAQSPYFAPTPPSQPSVQMFPPPYQYSATPPYAFSPGFYPPQAPVYMPWQQQPFQYYPPPPPPPLWAAPDSDGKRTLPPQQTVPAHIHLHHQQQQQQQQALPPQAYTFAGTTAAPPPHPPHSYAFAVAGHDHKLAPDTVLASTRAQSSPHSKRSGGRRRSGGGGSLGILPNGACSTINSANSTPCKGGRPPARAAALKSDLEEIEDAARTLAASAKDAVASADGVTLALLLTSWASSLEEAQNQRNTSNSASVPAPRFDAVFRASHALEIVSESILFMHITPDSAVHRALISLYGFVLYGGEVMHRRLADEARNLRDALGSRATDESSVDFLVTSLEKHLYVDMGIGSPTLTYKQAAVYKVLGVLRNVSDDVAAYDGILPNMSAVTNQGNIGTVNLSPAGPDPTKVVERSMDAWRRACARLQGEMAIVVVLEEALVAMDEQLAPPTGSSPELVEFFTSVSRIVKARLKSDIEQRNKALREVWWTRVATSDANSVFEAVDKRSCEWLGLFQTALSDLEAQLNNIGLGFGPAARVSAAKVPSLVNSSAGVAALISTHTHALDWCNETAELLSSMSQAFSALSETHKGSYRPPKELVKSFQNGVNRASTTIVGVQEWSFEPVYDKILGSLQKSAGAHNSTFGTQKSKGIRFEEPERKEIVRNLSIESQDEGKSGESDTSSQRRRKPRHARMKSSPDELLHLNAHLEVANGRASGQMIDDTESCESSEASPMKVGTRSVNGERSSPASLVTCASENSSKSGDELLTLQSELKQQQAGHREGSDKKVGELAVVYEEKLLEYEDEEEDSHIVVREDVEETTSEIVEEEGNGRKKVGHPSHARSMSVDGIPFGV